MKFYFFLCVCYNDAYFGISGSCAFHIFFLKNTALQISDIRLISRILQKKIELRVRDIHIKDNDLLVLISMVRMENLLTHIANRDKSHLSTYKQMRDQRVILMNIPSIMRLAVNQHNQFIGLFRNHYDHNQNQHDHETSPSFRFRFDIPVPYCRQCHYYKV
jgi:hypothetical protein